MKPVVSAVIIVALAWIAIVSLAWNDAELVQGPQIIEAALRLLNVR